MAPSRARVLIACISVGAVAVVSAGLWTSGATAAAPIREFTVVPSTSQAGGHPDIHTIVWMHNTATQDFPDPDCHCHDPKELTIDIPAGVVPDVHATPQCGLADFGENRCPIDSQIGFAYVGIVGATPADAKSYPIGVYNLVPHPNQPGLIGVYAPIIEAPIFIIASSRTEGDYGLTLKTVQITHIAPLSVFDFTIWGVPADPVNNDFRLYPPGCNTQGTGGVDQCKTGASSNSPLRPYVNNPTTCGVPLSTRLEVVAYDHEADEMTIPHPSTTGCDQLSFNPSLFGQPTTSEADTASGFDIDLKVPQNITPSVPSPSQIRATTVTFPEGMSINANAADGKSACSDADAHFDDRTLAAECPQSSKVGSLSVSSSSLPGPLPGYLYLASPKPGDRYRVLLVADGFGIHVKIPGSITPDPQTGRLVVSFENLPQFPFTDFNMHLFGSERGVLATSTHCGTYAVDSTFTPWDSALPSQTSHQFFSITAGPGGSSCPSHPRLFDPQVQAGVSDKSAAAQPTFTFQLNREDGEQTLSGTRLSTPPGLSAVLKGVSYCPDSTIAALEGGGYLGQSELFSPACPATSQIGTVTAGVGAGSRPLSVSGRVFLAGPYRDAPLSLVVVIPAVSGPYDLGNVAVRIALNVDPVDAHVSAISDPLPQIIGGIPLRTRSIQLNLDRSNFMLNPTNCDSSSIGAEITGDEGTQVLRNRHFQVANCAGLPYAPKLSLRLTGGLQRRGHPAIHAVLRAQRGEANSRSISVVLPKGELLDNSHIRAVCTRVAFAQDRCPPGSRLGHAKVTSPLLDQPLAGNVYLRSSQHELPDLALDLEGQIDIEATGRVDSVNERYRTTFSTIPDVPISQVTLDLAGGRKGLLQNSESLCGKHNRAKVKMIGQNGNRADGSVKLSVPCGNDRKARR